MTAAFEQVLRNANLETLATILVALALGWEGESDEAEKNTNTTALDMVVHVHGSYSDLTVAQLRQIASGYQIKGCWKMRKSELICALDSIPAQDQDIDFLKEVVVEDKEQERFTRCFVGYDQFGCVYEDVPTWAFNDSKWGTAGGNSSWQGYSGLMPYENTPSAPAQLSIEGAGLAVDEERSGAGFLPEDLTGNGSYTSTSWKWGKQAHRRYIQWMMFVHKCNDEKKLRRGWRQLWQRFFDCKASGEDFFLSPVELKNLKAAFAAKGIKSRNRK